jgi:hypothetical protein
MDPTIVTRLVKEGKQHGLTLQWAQVHLIERLPRTEQHLKALRNRDTRESLADATRTQSDAGCFPTEAHPVNSSL